MRGNEVGIGRVSVSVSGVVGQGVAYEQYPWGDL